MAKRGSRGVRLSKLRTATRPARRHYGHACCSLLPTFTLLDSTRRLSRVEGVLVALDAGGRVCRVGAPGLTTTAGAARTAPNVLDAGPNSRALARRIDGHAGSNTTKAIDAFARATTRARAPNPPTTLLKASAPAASDDHDLLMSATRTPPGRSRRF